MTKTHKKRGDLYKELFNYINSGVVVSEIKDQGGRDFVIKDLNKAAEGILKIKKEDVVGKSIFDVFQGFKDFCLLDVVKMVWQSGNPEHFPVSQYDDGRITGWFDNYVIKLPLGEIVVVSNDVTDRKQAEDALKESEEQLRQAQKMEAVGRLAGGLAHDFNNLLTVVLGYSEIIMMHAGADEGLSKNVGEIKKAAEKAATLAHQLLAFSRKQILRPKVLYINDLISNMEKMLYRLIGENVQLTTRLDPELGLIKVDPGQFEQIIMNLAVNARDAMPKGGTITIKTKNTYPDTGYGEHHTPVRPGPCILISVSDTGEGMDAETQNKIFEPFFTTKEKGKGTGLGLATVYGIVEQSGGYIWVKSELNRGTTFEIQLPIVENIEAEQIKRIESGVPERGTETILIVEDEEAVRKMVITVLENYGYSVFEAKNGLEALQLNIFLKERPINLLITDVVIPGMSGIDVAEQFSAQRPGMKVLYMSGYTDDAVINCGVLKEAINFLQKPFTPNSLARKVREALDEES